MGILLGLPNQLLLIGFGVGLCLMIVIGYRLWSGFAALPGHQPVRRRRWFKSWLMLSVWGRAGVGLLAMTLRTGNAGAGGESAAVYAGRLAALGSRVTRGNRAASRLRLRRADDHGDTAVFARPFADWLLAMGYFFPNPEWSDWCAESSHLLTMRPPRRA